MDSFNIPSRARHFTCFVLKIVFQRNNIKPMAHFKTENKLALSTFLSQGSIVIFNFTLVYYLRECGIDSVGIGLASSIYPTLYFLGCIFMPKFLPSLKGKARILAANIGMAFTGLVLTFIKNEALIMTDLVFYGLFQSLLWTNMETWITGGKEGGELTSRLTLFNFSWSFSVGLATSFSGFVSEYSTRLSIWSGCVFFLISALLVALSGRSYDSKKEKEEIVSEDHSSPLRFPSWAGVLLVYTGYSLVLTVFPQYAMDTLGYSESVTGNILLFRGISVTIAFLIMQKVRVWQKGVGPILGSQAFFAILTFLMLFLRSIAAFAILFALYGFVFALSYDLSIFHGAEGAKDRHKRMVIHEVLLTLGTIIGSLVGGFVYQYFSFKTLVLTISILSVVIVVIEALALSIKRE